MLLRQSVSFALLLSVACGNSTAQAGDNDVLTAGVKPVAIASAATATTSTEGRITGMIKVEGKVEKTKDVPAKDLASDPTCAEMHGDGPMASPIGVILSEDGGLKDVFIQLTSGVPDVKYDVPETPFVLDQKGCTYEPHVWGVMKKQQVVIKSLETNYDPVAGISAATILGNGMVAPILDADGLLVARMEGYECVIDAGLESAFRSRTLRV